MHNSKAADQRRAQFHCNNEPIHLCSVHQLLRQRQQAAVARGDGPAAHPPSVGPTDPATPRRKNRPPGTPDEREALAAFLGDFARELGDEAPLSSTITRVLILLQTAQLPPEQWGDVLYQARSITQERTPQIRTLAADGASSLRRKNKMPYFLAVLEDVLGLAQDRPSAPSS